MQTSIKKSYIKPAIVELNSIEATQGMAPGKADMGTENGGGMTSAS